MAGDPEALARAHAQADQAPEQWQPFLHDLAGQLFGDPDTTIGRVHDGADAAPHLEPQDLARYQTARNVGVEVEG